MASKTLFFLLGLIVLVVAVSAWEDETEEITVEDLQEYFMPSQMEKRGPKVGPCTMYNGKPCAVCNLKIKNKKDTRRYIACAGKGPGSI